MRRHKHLYPQMVAFPNLLKAARLAQRGKRFKDATARFNFFLERELWQLHHELAAHRYVPGRYVHFEIYEPKRSKELYVRVMAFTDAASVRKGGKQENSPQARQTVRQYNRASKASRKAYPDQSPWLRQRSWPTEERRAPPVTRSLLLG